MVIAYLIAGMASGALLAAIGFVAGSSLWSIFLLYTFGGSLATLGLAGLVYALPRNSAASADEIGAATPESVKA